MPPTRRPDDTTPPRKPWRDPLDIPLDEPLPDESDPLDDFRMIEPAPGPTPSRPAAAGKSPPSRPGPAARVRRPARAPDPVVPRKWLLPAGIALAVSLVVVPSILVLATGTPSRNASPLPPYPVAVAQPGQQAWPQQNLPPMPGGFAKVFTPGVDPEPKAAPLGPNRDGGFEIPDDFPKSLEPPKMPERAAAPKPDRAPGLLRGNAPAFLKVTAGVLPAFKGQPLTEVDVSNGTGVSVCVGGRGRYLFVATGTRPQIDVYDLTTAAKLRSVVCEDAQYPYIRLLAGADVLVAMSSATGRATSWRLDDLDRPTTRMVGHIDSRVSLLAPGSNGPLVVADGREGRRTSLFDPATLEPVRYEFESDWEREKFSGSEPTSINSTGTVLTCSPGYASPPSDLWRISGTTIRRVSEDGALGKLTRAVVSANGDKLVCAETAIDLPSGRVSKWSPPTGNAARAFSVDASEEKFVSATAGGFAEVELWKPGFEESIARLDKDDDAIALIRKTERRGGTPTRVFCVGRTNVVVMVSYDRVLIWHADAERQKGTRRLGGVTVPPMPPKTVVKPPMPPKVEVTIEGEQGRVEEVYEGSGLYTSRVQLKPPFHDDLRYELEKGPKGMTINGAFTLWRIPADTPTGDYEVVVRVSNEEKGIDLTDRWTVRYKVPAVPLKFSPSDPDASLLDRAKALGRGQKPAFRAASAEKPPAYTGEALKVVDLRFPKSTGPLTACVGGRGRYLFVCANPSTGIQVYDLAAGKWLKSLKCEGRTQGARMHLAAGADYLVATDGTNHRIRSWSLDDLDALPKEARLEWSGITGLALGGESNGPLFVGYSSAIVTIGILDPKTLEPVKYELGTIKQSNHFAYLTPIAVDATGKVLTTNSGRGATRKYSLWKIGADSILPFDPVVELTGETASGVSRGGSMLMPSRTELIRLPGRDPVAEPPLPKAAERVWSVGPGEEVIATVGPDAGRGLRTMAVQLWKPGRKGPLARLSDDPAANALILADSTKFSAPVAQPGRVFCVGGWNLVIVVGDEKVWIWHADPARQKPEAAPKSP